MKGLSDELSKLELDDGPGVVDRFAERSREAERQRSRDMVAWLHHAGAAMNHLLDVDAIPDGIRAAAVAIRDGLPAHGLIAGPVGTGKTVAAKWLIASLWDAGGWDDPEFPSKWMPRCSALRLPCVAIQRAVYNPAGGELQRKIDNVRLLVIEDVRWLPDSAWRLADEMHAIVDHRVDRGLSTFVTTNMLPPEFQGAYEPIYSRLAHARPGLVVMKGEDRRAAAK